MFSTVIFSHLTNVSVYYLAGRLSGLDAETGTQLFVVEARRMTPTEHSQLQFGGSQAEIVARRIAEFELDALSARVNPPTERNPRPIPTDARTASTLAHAIAKGTVSHDRGGRPYYHGPLHPQVWSGHNINPAWDFDAWN